MAGVALRVIGARLVSLSALQWQSRNPPNLIYRNSCISGHPITSRATPETVGGRTEAIGVWLVSFREGLVSSLAAIYCKRELESVHCVLLKKFISLLKIQG
jgi:hypothetical protein